MSNNRERFELLAGKWLREFIEEDEHWAACESPIEVLFASALEVVAASYGGSVYRSLGAVHPPQDRILYIVPQYRLGAHRVDFLIWWRDANLREAAIVVECDGHDFHEKTKEQAARDKKRDRYLSMHVARVLRFTGSEIYRDPFACAEEAFGLMDGLYADWQPR